MGYGKTVREELRAPSRELRHAIPQVYAGYKQLYDSALAAGALDVRTKELIALAIAVSKDATGASSRTPTRRCCTARPRPRRPRRSASRS